MNRSTVVIGALAAPIALLGAFIVMIPLMFSEDSCQGPTPLNVVDATTTTFDGLNADQLGNARIIISAGEALGVAPKGQVIAVMTALGESGLRNLDYGDQAGPDSRGLFQQRDNGAWGTYAERMDPATATTNFYKALLTVEGWEELGASEAAHRVQRNADPHHYDKYHEQAQKVVAQLTGAVDQVIQEALCIENVSWGSGADCDFPGVDNPRTCQEALQSAATIAALRPCSSNLPGGTWRRWCLAFVAQAYGYQYAGEPTARAMYETLNAQGMVSTSSDNIPAGALVFFSSSDPAGHVALYAGDGMAYSNDYVRLGCIDLTPMDAMASGGQFLGWSPPYFPKAG